jgi:hypothetical protein
MKNHLTNKNTEEITFQSPVDPINYRVITSDTKTRHTNSGRAFKEVPLVNLFKKNYGEEGFYSGKEADLTDEDHSEPAG